MLENNLFDLQLFAEEGAPEGGSPSGGEPGGGSSTGTPPERGGGEPGGGTPSTGKTFTQAEVENLIKARVAQAQQSASEKYKDYDRYSNVVQRISKLTNQPVEHIERQLEQMELQYNARSAGMPPQLFQHLSQQSAETAKLKKDYANIQLELQETQLASNPTYAQAFKDPETKAQIREFAEKAGVTLEQAYWATVGPQMLSQTEREIEARVINNLKTRLGPENVILNEESSEITSLGLTKEEIAYCRESGQDPEEYAFLKNNNSIQAFRNRKKKKAAK